MEIKTTNLGRIVIVDTEGNSKDVTDECIKAVASHMKYKHLMYEKMKQEELVLKFSEKVY